MNAFKEITEVTPKFLEECRKNNVSYYVKKEDGKLFFSECERKVNFRTGKGRHNPHLCGHCKLFYSSECPKFKEGSTGIERYPWITKGYESYNVSEEAFVVLECENFQPHTCNRSYTRLTEAGVFELALHLYPDATSWDKVKRRVERNVGSEEF